MRAEVASFVKQYGRRAKEASSQMIAKLTKTSRAV